MDAVLKHLADSFKPRLGQLIDRALSSPRVAMVDLPFAHDKGHYRASKNTRHACVLSSIPITALPRKAIF
jgi:hypothetical protein